MNETNRVTLKIVPLISIFIIAVGALFLSGCSVTGTQTVTIDESSITDEMQKFTYDADGVEVTYFLVRDGDGQIRSGFDACDVCGGAKGYRQKGDQVVCNNCGLSFAIEDLGVQNRGGGCWPRYLSHEIDDEGLIHLPKEELREGRERFI